MLLLQSRTALHNDEIILLLAPALACVTQYALFNQQLQWPQKCLLGRRADTR
jgi:hypothetical protein